MKKITEALPASGKYHENGTRMSEAWQMLSPENVGVMLPLKRWQQGVLRPPPGADTPSFLVEHSWVLVATGIEWTCCECL